MTSPCTVVGAGLAFNSAPVEIVAMRAASIVRYNSPVTIGAVPDPICGDRDVLIRVHGAGISALDHKVRRGDLGPFSAHDMPLVLGGELSGVVVAVGAHVTGLQVGDEVWACLPRERPGAFAELCAVDAALVAPKPPSLSHVEAAAVPLCGLAAWQALREVAAIKKHDKVLILGGAGGVGTLAVQIAIASGCYVAATCSDFNLNYVVDLGADKAIDFLHADLRKVASNRHVVFDAVGGKWLSRSFAAVREGGSVVSIAGERDAATLAALGATNWQLAAGWMATFGTRFRAFQAGAQYRYHDVRPDAAGLVALAELVESGQLRPFVREVFSLDDAEVALKKSAFRHGRGKMVIDLTI